MSDTQLQQLVINVGTTAQIEAGIQGGTITNDMFSVATDNIGYLTTDDAMQTSEADTETLEELDTVTPTSLSISEIMQTITGYDASATQTLKNVNGNFQWVTD